MANSERCEICLYWGELESFDTAEGMEVFNRCRRFPPRRGGYDDPRAWPFTDRKDWCGEFRRKE